MLGCRVGIIGSSKRSSDLPVNPFLWLDAQDLTTLYSDIAGTTQSGTGGYVGKWADKSGNNKHALASANDTTRPTTNNTDTTYQINGKNAVRYTNSPQTKLISSSLAYNYQYLNIFVVCKRIGYVSDSVIYNLNNKPTTSSDNSVQKQGFIVDGEFSRLTPYSNGGFKYCANPGDNVPYLFSVHYNGSGLISFYNGTQNTLGSDSVISGNFILSELCMGPRYISNGYIIYGNFVIGEVLIYNVDLTVTIRNQIKTYLANKWGITVA